jgi:hypothetical protein
MKVNWLVDTLLTERAENTGYPTLAEAARELGHTVYQTKYVPFSDRPFEGKASPFGISECVVAYGTVQFCKQIEKFCGKMWTPGMYFNANVESFSKFACQMGNDLLNDDYYILPYGECVRRGAANGIFFIKPESGMKEFTGQVIRWASFEDDLKKLSPHHTIDPDTLCVIAAAKDIKAEFRYVICEKEVITGSEYRWDNKLDVRRDTHPICDKMANKIAKADWQADTVYVCDVALVADWAGEDVAKVIELNAFSSSGLYACDTYKIVEAVSKAAWKEHCGETGD